MKAKNKTHTMHQNAKHHLRGLGSNRVSGQRLKDSLLRTRVPVHPSAVLHTAVGETALLKPKSYILKIWAAEMRWLQGGKVLSWDDTLEAL